MIDTIKIRVYGTNKEESFKNKSLNEISKQYANPLTNKKDNSL
ncbi:MAG: hypothetical protein ACI9Q3_001018 [Maribacter sp.]|jgi:hypothetical protein